MVIKTYTISELRKKTKQGHPFGLTKIETQRTELLEYCENRLQSIDHSLDPSTIRATFGGNEKEIDWAVAGGLASGIGGLGAGVSAAANAQLENAKIRERNAQRDAMTRRIMNLAGAAKSEMAAEYIRTIQTLTKPVKKKDEPRINITDSTKALSEHLILNYDPYDKQPFSQPYIGIQSTYEHGRIDGYLKVTVEKEGDYIVPMPYLGVSHTEGTGFYIDTLKENYIHHTVNKVVPVILWVIEEKKQKNNYPAHDPLDVKDSEGYQQFSADWNALCKATVPPLTGQQIMEFFQLFAIITCILTFILFLIVLFASNNTASPGAALTIPFVISCIISFFITWCIQNG